MLWYVDFSLHCSSTLLIFFFSWEYNYLHYLQSYLNQNIILKRGDSPTSFLLNLVKFWLIINSDEGKHLNLIFLNVDLSQLKTGFQLWQLHKPLAAQHWIAAANFQWIRAAEAEQRLACYASNFWYEAATAAKICSAVADSMILKLLHWNNG